MAVLPSSAEIVFLDRATIPPEATLAPFGFGHTLTVHERTDPAQVVRRIANADIVIVNKTPVDARAIAGAPRLKLVAVAATGTDNVDVDACVQRGIAVTNIREYALHTVPEHTFMLMLALRRSLFAYRDAVRAGRWQAAGQFCFFDHPIGDLAGSTLGLVGDGVIGREVARLARAFGMHVVFADHRGDRKPDLHYLAFDDLLRTSDVISLHVPLRPETRHLIDDAAFDRMARRPLLVNTARGGIVDETALARALRDGRISGAGFDVSSLEPPDDGHPLNQLLALPNFILTPHVAWASREAAQALADQLVEVIDAYWRGAPRNIVAA